MPNDYHSTTRLIRFQHVIDFARDFETTRTAGNSGRTFEVHPGMIWLHGQKRRPEDEVDRAQSVWEEFYPGGRKRGMAVRIQADYSKKGRLLRYSMALMDTQHTSVDNGRILGYDNAHGYHHRHHLGKIEPVEFESYESTEKRFEAQVRKHLESGKI